VEAEVKERVRRFYDSIGWQEIGEGVYQNARYEDLRPVSREYIHRCHIRLARHLRDQGDFFLDAGSGPIQYPEYLTYSQGFRCRVCLDISRRTSREMWLTCPSARTPFSRSPRYTPCTTSQRNSKRGLSAS